MSRRTAWRLYSEAGITSAAQRRRRSKNKKQGPPVFDDFVKRVFDADAPNRLWLTDITEHVAAWIPAVVARLDRRLAAMASKNYTEELASPAWISCQ